MRNFIDICKGYYSNIKNTYKRYTSAAAQFKNSIVGDALYSSVKANVYEFIGSTSLPMALERSVTPMVAENLSYVISYAGAACSSCATGYVAYKVCNYIDGAIEKDPQNTSFKRKALRKTFIVLLSTTSAICTMNTYFTFLNDTIEEPVHQTTDFMIYYVGAIIGGYIGNRLALVDFNDPLVDFSDHSESYSVKFIASEAVTNGLALSMKAKAVGSIIYNPILKPVIDFNIGALVFNGKYIARNVIELLKTDRTLIEFIIDNTMISEKELKEIIASCFKQGFIKQQIHNMNSDYLMKNLIGLSSFPTHLITSSVSNMKFFESYNELFKQYKNEQDSKTKQGTLLAIEEIRNSIVMNSVEERLSKPFNMAHLIEVRKVLMSAFDDNKFVEDISSYVSNSIGDAFIKLWGIGQNQEQFLYVKNMVRIQCNVAIQCSLINCCYRIPEIALNESKDMVVAEFLKSLYCNVTDNAYKLHPENTKKFIKESICAYFNIHNVNDYKCGKSFINFINRLVHTHVEHSKYVDKFINNQR